ncbi:MAG: type II secretion system F family protein [Wolinella sp.]
MKYFNVTLLLKGKRSKRIVKASTRDEALVKAAQLKRGKPLFAKEIAAPLGMKLADIASYSFDTIRGKNRIKLDDMIPAFRQMSLMLNAGISIHATLEDLVTFSASDRLKTIFRDILTGISSGKSLSDSFRIYERDLGTLSISLISLGEQTGSLSHALAMLAETLEEIRNNTAKFKKALRYPTMVVGAMVAAFVLLILLVIPKFKSVFDSFNAELPLPTIILLRTEEILSNYGLWILGALIAIVVLLRRRYRRSLSFKKLIDRYLLKVKLIGDIIYYHSMNQYVSALSLLLKAGISLEEALSSGSGMTTNEHIREKFESVSEAIKRGIGLTEAFRATGLFEPTTLQMVNTGEQSGDLDQMLAVAANYYKMRYDNIIDNLSAYIEPLLTAFMAVLVLILALGIFMPMWDLARAVRT